MSERRRLPEIYDLETILAALEDHGELLSAFTWDDTPEGHEFWLQQYEVGLTVEGREALTLMIAEAGGSVDVAEGGDSAKSLADEVAELRAQVRYWKRGTDLINECLKTAARADHGDAPFPLDHAEAKFWHNAQMEAYRHALEMMGLPQDFGPVEKVTA